MQHLNDNFVKPMLYPNLYEVGNDNQAFCYHVILSGSNLRKKIQLVKAVYYESESKCAVYHVKPDIFRGLYDDCVGMRDLYQRAVETQPSIIFIDNCDALFEEDRSILVTLKTSMFGIKTSHGVWVIYSSEKHPLDVDAGLFQRVGYHFVVD